MKRKTSKRRKDSGVLRGNSHRRRLGNIVPFGTFAEKVIRIGGVEYGICLIGDF
jgi:hypothetical protein